MPLYTPSFSPDYSLITAAAERDQLSRLRSSLYPWNKQEKDHTVHIILGLDMEAEKFTKDIVDLENVISSLKEERSRFLAEAQKFRSLLSPIRQLPQDILAEIFKSVAAEAAITVSHTIMLPILNASHACAFWRKVIHSTPSLWNQVTIDASQSSNPRFKRYRDFFKWIVEKSGDAALHLRFLSNPRDDDETASSRYSHTPHYKKTLEPLLHQSPRYESLAIEGANIASESSVYHLLNGNLDNLKRLSLHVRYDRDGDNREITLFEKAPALTEVNLNFPRRRSWNQHSQLSIPLLPWKQLNSLNLVSGDFSQYHYILSQCRNLKSLQFKPSSYPWDIRTQSTTIRMLENFCFDAHRVLPECVVAVFQDLTLPSLKRLEFIGSSSLEWPVELQRMILRSQCSLLSLSITAATSQFDSTPICDIFPFLGSLTSLSLTERMPGCLVSSALLSKLHVNHQDSVLLPNLNYLSLETPTIHFDHDLCVALLKMRYDNEKPTATCAKMETVKLRFPSVMEEDLYEVYGDMIQRGWNVHVSGCKPRFICL